METRLIYRDPEIMGGAPCFTGTRVLAQNLFDYLEGSSTLADFLEDFPSVSRAAAIGVLEAAKEWLFANAPIVRPVDAALPNEDEARSNDFIQRQDEN